MRLIDLDLDLLRCFAAVAEAGSFTAAGEAIGLTQSGVSVRIRRLEEQLETRVLERTSRSVTLTPEGEVLLGYARRMLDLNDETVRRLRAPWAEGDLRIGIADYFAPNVLPTLLGRFCRHYPRIRLSVRTGLGLDLIPAFERGELDLVLAGQEEELQGGEILLHEPLIWVTAEAGLSGNKLPLPLVALPQPCSHRRAAIDGLEQQGRQWDIVFTSSSIAGVQAAVRAGLGIGVLPRSALTEGLRPADDSLGLPPLPYSAIAVFAQKDVNTAVRTAFVDFLVEELKQTTALSESPRLHVA